MKSRLSTQMEVYSEGSFAQINRVVDTWWSEVNGGIGWKHVNEQSSSISRTGRFPTTSIETEGSASIEVVTSVSATGEFSVSALTFVGFSFWKELGSDLIYRKPISMDYVYTLY